MPAFIVASLLAAGISTGVGYAAGTIAAGALGSAFLGAFATSVVLGGLSNALPKKPQ